LGANATEWRLLKHRLALNFDPLAPRAALQNRLA
jgi:hypothetical protein